MKEKIADKDWNFTPLVHEYLDDREYLGVVRASISMFTGYGEADALVEALGEI